MGGVCLLLCFVYLFSSLLFGVFVFVIVVLVCLLWGLFVLSWVTFHIVGLFCFCFVF